jgi:hypothetical protein
MVVELGRKDREMWGEERKEKREEKKEQRVPHAGRDAREPGAKTTRLAFLSTLSELSEPLLLP